MLLTEAPLNSKAYRERRTQTGQRSRPCHVRRHPGVAGRESFWSRAAACRTLSRHTRATRCRTGSSAWTRTTKPPGRSDRPGLPGAFDGGADEPEGVHGTHDAGCFRAFNFLSMYAAIQELHDESCWIRAAACRTPSRYTRATCGALLRRGPRNRLTGASRQLREYLAVRHDGTGNIFTARLHFGAVAAASSRSFSSWRAGGLGRRCCRSLHLLAGAAVGLFPRSAHGDGPGGLILAVGAALTSSPHCGFISFVLLGGPGPGTRCCRSLLSAGRGGRAVFFLDRIMDTDVVPSSLGRCCGLASNTLRRAGGQAFTVLPVFALLSGASVGLGLALAWSRTAGGLTRMPCEFGRLVQNFPHCTSLRPAPGGLAFSRWRALGPQALPRHLAGELLATAARTSWQCVASSREPE